MKIEQRLVASGYFCMEVVVLCLPAFLNRSPVLFTDTQTYYTGGRTAIEKIVALLVHPAQGASVEKALREARGVRSAYFALYEYITANIGTLWFTIAIQGAIVVLLLRLIFSMLRPQSPRWHLTAIVVFLALFTTASWTVSYVMPDVFNAIGALAITATAVFWERLRPMQRVALAVVIAASVTMHLTNLITACGMLALGALLRWRFWSSLAMGGAIAAALLALLLVGRAGFHQWTISPQSPPFLTARIIADGPGKLYLRNNCPNSGFIMCRYLDRLDLDPDDLVWHENGVYSAYDVTPADRAAIRAEDKRLYVTAALAYPGLWLRTLALNVARQLGDFTLENHIVPSWATYTHAAMDIWPEVDERSATYVYHEPELERVWDVVLYATVLGSVIYLLLLAQRRVLTRDEVDVFVLAMAAAWLSALAGALSEVAPRYEARAIWLVPTVAALVFVPRWARSGTPVPGAGGGRSPARSDGRARHALGHPSNVSTRSKAT
jgi:hypothetical protein